MFQILVLEAFFFFFTARHFLVWGHATLQQIYLATQTLVPLYKRQHNSCDIVTSFSFPCINILPVDNQVDLNI